jgi:hypothetical protein
VQLVQKLRRSGVAIDDPRIIAVTGWTTDELSAGMDQAHLAPAYDLVTLLIGVNNQYRGRPASEYRGLSCAAACGPLAGRQPSERVIVVSIPDWGVTPFAHASGREARQNRRRIGRFQRDRRDETTVRGAHFVNITGFRAAIPMVVAADGLHPSSAQYTLWTGCDRR